MMSEDTLANMGLVDPSESGDARFHGATNEAEEWLYQTELQVMDKHLILQEKSQKVLD